MNQCVFHLSNIHTHSFWSFNFYTTHVGHLIFLGWGVGGKLGVCGSAEFLGSFHGFWIHRRHFHVFFFNHRFRQVVLTFRLVRTSSEVCMFSATSLASSFIQFFQVFSNLLQPRKSSLSFLHFSLLLSGRPALELYRLV